MKVTRINWPLIQQKMRAEKGIKSWSALAGEAGVHRNTLGREGPFSSTTIDRLGDYFGCDPRELIMLEDAPGTPPTKPKVPDMDTSQVPPEKAKVEAERKAALLAQAAQLRRDHPDA